MAKRNGGKDPGPRPTDAAGYREAWADLEARPSLAEVLPLRNARLAVVRKVMTGLSDEALERETVRVRGPGYPRAGTYAVRRCVQTLMNEGWQHRRYAERDLAILEARL